MILVYFMVSLFLWPMSLFTSCWLRYLGEPNLASHLHQYVTPVMSVVVKSAVSHSGNMWQ